jgi:hypothetical protein
MGTTGSIVRQPRVKMVARPVVFLLASTLVLAGCTQITDYNYSRKNFTTPTFESDLAACRHPNAPFSAFQPTPQEQRAQLDDAAVRDCMKTKGYKIETEGR